MAKSASIWVVDNQHVVHYANCDELVLRPSPYHPLSSRMGDDGKPVPFSPKTASDMLTHIARPDTDKNGNISGAASILSACQCVTETAEREI